MFDSPLFTTFYMQYRQSIHKVNQIVNFFSIYQIKSSCCSIPLFSLIFIWKRNYSGSRLAANGTAVPPRSNRRGRDGRPSGTRTTRTTTTTTVGVSAENATPRKEVAVVRRLGRTGLLAALAAWLPCWRVVVSGGCGRLCKEGT